MTRAVCVAEVTHNTMTSKNGSSAAIVAFVRSHPGCTRAELLAGLGRTDLHWAMPTYCAQRGLIFAAGVRSQLRYYVSQRRARREHKRLVVEAELQRAVAAQRRAEAKRQYDIDRNLRQRIARHAAGGKAINTRPGRHQVVLDPGVRLAPGFRLTVAPPMMDRWA